MAILGAHMSISGGHYRSVEIAKDCGCDCVQLFTKNNNQWNARDITPEEVTRFSESLKQHGIKHPIAHDSYLINLGSPDNVLWKKSINACVIELRRAAQLGIPFVVAHPGAYTTSSEELGLKRIAKGLDEVHRQTRGVRSCCLLETTAGQGSNLGWKFEHLAAIIDKVKDPERLGVCFDTCHVFAAGYGLKTAEEYKQTMRELDQTVGVKLVKAFHFNDSKRERGSRVDRHEHIGVGHLGLEPFRFLLNDRRFAKVPMYLETPKGETKGVPWDVTNLKKLRGLIAKR